MIITFLQGTDRAVTTSFSRIGEDNLPLDSQSRENLSASPCLASRFNFWSVVLENGSDKRADFRSNVAYECERVYSIIQPTLQCARSYESALLANAWPHRMSLHSMSFSSVPS